MNELQTTSQRFLESVKRNFTKQVAKRDFTEYEQILAQNLFVGINKTLEDLEANRIKKNQTQRMPIVWKNVDMDKLAIDAVNRVKLGLDATIKNHLFSIPYQNSKTGKYDLDLRIGYEGKFLVHMTKALGEIDSIMYELVHETDHFKVNPVTFQNPVPSFEFEIKNPFNRGKVIGGFGYVKYKEESKNKLILVSAEEFKKSQNAARDQSFWGNHLEKMQLKTLKHRICDQIQLDPRKINIVEFEEAVSEYEHEDDVVAEVQAEASETQATEEITQPPQSEPENIEAKQTIITEEDPY